MPEHTSSRAPATDAERRASSLSMLDRFAAAAAKSNRPDAADLSAHYAKRATKVREGR